jgi:hypothetical protein
VAKVPLISEGFVRHSVEDLHGEMLGAFFIIPQEGRRQNQIVGNEVAIIGKQMSIASIVCNLLIAVCQSANNDMILVDTAGDKIIEKRFYRCKIVHVLAVP